MGTTRAHRRARAAGKQRHARLRTRPSAARACRRGHRRPRRDRCGPACVSGATVQLADVDAQPSESPHRGGWYSHASRASLRSCSLTSEPLSSAPRAKRQRVHRASGKPRIVPLERRRSTTYHPAPWDSLYGIGSAFRQRARGQAEVCWPSPSTLTLILATVAVSPSVGTGVVLCYLLATPRLGIRLGLGWTSSCCLASIGGGKCARHPDRSAVEAGGDAAAVTGRPQRPCLR